LSRRRRDALKRRLLQGARQNGFPTDLWTGPRIAALIRDLWGVAYHNASMPRFLKALGFSCQRPQKQAVERDEAAIQRWIQKDWPRIKRGRPAGGRP
jgi:transposase